PWPGPFRASPEIARPRSPPSAGDGGLVQRGHVGRFWGALGPEPSHPPLPDRVGSPHGIPRLGPAGAATSLGAVRPRVARLATDPGGRGHRVRGRERLRHPERTVWLPPARSERPHRRPQLRAGALERPEP